MPARMRVSPDYRPLCSARCAPAPHLHLRRSPGRSLQVSDGKTQKPPPFNTCPGRVLSQIASPAKLLDKENKTQYLR